MTVGCFSLMFSVLLIMPTTSTSTSYSLSSSCSTNTDCVSSCCSGWGWCVGPGSGKSLTFILKFVVSPLLTRSRRSFYSFSTLSMLEGSIWSPWDIRHCFLLTEMSPPGWSCSGLVTGGMSRPGSCASHEDCPQTQPPTRCCSPWGWCTDKCGQ